MMPFKNQEHTSPFGRRKQTAFDDSSVPYTFVSSLNTTYLLADPTPANFLLAHMHIGL